AAPSASRILIFDSVKQLIDTVTDRVSREVADERSRARTRRPDRGGAALHPLLHTSYRAVAGGTLAKRLLARGSARALPARRSLPHDRDRARRRARSRRGISEPHPAPLRRRGSHQQEAHAGRRPPEPDLDHREGPKSLRAAQQGLARPGRRNARASL